jgi:hypothetical protein
LREKHRKEDEEKKLDELDVIERKNRQQEKIRERSKLLKTFKEDQKKRKRKSEIKEKNSPCYHPIFERRFTVIARAYIGSFFVFDILACLPIFVYEAMNGFTTDLSVKEEAIDHSLYQILAAFKIFKLFMVLRIFSTLELIENVLKDIFIFEKIFIENMMNYVKVLIELILLIHLAACIWIFVSFANDTWDYFVIVRDNDDFYNSYFDSLYFMTTTMTSVGYGDRSGFPVDFLMGFVMFAQFAGILSFSLIKFNVFNTKSKISVNDLVTEIGEQMTDYLNSLNTIRKDVNIRQEYMDEALEYVQNSERYSTRVPLHLSNFWNNLPSNLQSQLFNVILGKTVKRFEFFFHDYNLGNHTSQAFIMSIMTRLNSRLYEKGSIIIKQEKPVENLIFINFGCLHIYGYHEFKDQEMLRFKACTLPKGSWYGDYQILLNVTSNWDIEAGLDMKGKASNSLPADMMQVYELP